MDKSDNLAYLNWGRYPRNDSKLGRGGVICYGTSVN